MTQITTIENHPPLKHSKAPARASSLEELFCKDEFLRTVLIGFAGGFGLSTLVILFSLEVTTLRAAMAEQLGIWWFMVPAFTVVGFALWTFMLVRIRRHRFTRMLRAEAFKRNHDAGNDSESSEDAGIDEAQPAEDWL